MASKVLKVKLWDGEDGKKWKCNVSDIEGEILCGAFLLFMSIFVSSHVMPTIMVPAIDGKRFLLTLVPNTNAILPLSSLTIHSPRVDEEGKQA